MLYPVSCLKCLLIGWPEYKFPELEQANKAIPKYNNQSNFQAGKATQVSHTSPSLTQTYWSPAHLGLSFGILNAKGSWSSQFNGLSCEPP